MQQQLIDRNGDYSFMWLIQLKTYYYSITRMASTHEHLLRHKISLIRNNQGKKTEKSIDWLVKYHIER